MHYKINNTILTPYYLLYFNKIFLKTILSLCSFYYIWEYYIFQ